MKLNEEQTAAVEHPVGAPAVLIAGAGSGKTRVLTERVRWLMEQGVVPRRICAITFTNKAAGELKERLGIGIDTPMDKEPRVSTIHSLALSGIRKNPKAFGLGEKVTPLDEYDQAQLMKKIVERSDANRDFPVEREKGFVYVLLEKIGFHRARGVGFRNEYTRAVHDRAMEQHAGYHAMTEELLDLWELFEQEKSKNSVVDFDDMLHLVVRRMRRDPQWKAALQRQFEHVLMDEAQDTNPVQWEFVNGLMGPDNKNLYVVGDISQSIFGFNGAVPDILIKFAEDWRGTKPLMYKITRNHRSLKQIVHLANKIQHTMTHCHPEGVKIRLLDEPKGYRGRHGTSRAKFKDVSVECVRENELVQPWVSKSARTKSTGVPFEIARQRYTGPVISISTASGLSTKVTPNHWLWVKFDKDKIRDEYVVYLMHKKGKGFRVGKTRLRSNGNGFGLSKRLNAEGGDKAWILKVLPSNLEAEVWEEIFSAKYGIPESIFAQGANTKSQEHIDLIFASVPENGGFRCLEEHGLSFESPLLTAGKRPWLGYFKTLAVNILPIAVYLDVPVSGVSQSTPITSVTVEDYDGWVYSLNVDTYHTYLADGIVVGNSIPLQMETFREEAGEWRLALDDLPSSIASGIAAQIQQDARRKRDPILYRENAILVRSGMQIRDLEGELVRRRIPYIVRGGKALLQTEEIRDILGYLRLASNHKDFTAFMRCCSVPRCGVGEVALNKLRADANQENDGDLLLAARNNERLHNLISIVEQIEAFEEAPITAVEKLLALFDYRKYISVKYQKDKDKVKTKLENIERFITMVAALTDGNDKTLDDLIFQMALDRSKGDETEKALYDRQLAAGELTPEEHEIKMQELRNGSVTISTIHSAKGLEWRRVWVTNLHEGSLPNRFAMGSDEEIEEERRLFYVACTRARDILVLCVSEKMPVRGSANYQRLAPSRFLKEIGALVAPKASK